MHQNAPQFWTGFRTYVVQKRKNTFLIPFHFLKTVNVFRSAFRDFENIRCKPAAHSVYTSRERPLAWVAVPDLTPRFAERAKQALRPFAEEWKGELSFGLLDGSKFKTDLKKRLL